MPILNLLSFKLAWVLSSWIPDRDINVNIGTEVDEENLGIDRLDKYYVAKRWLFCQFYRIRRTSLVLL